MVSCSIVVQDFMFHGFVLEMNVCLLILHSIFFFL